MTLRLLPVVPALLAAVLLSTAAAAQTQSRETAVYKCGPDGRELRNSPCPDKPQAPAQLVAYDQPDSAQIKDAQARAKADQAKADKLERERLEAEAQQRQNAPGAIGINGSSKQPNEAKPSAPKKPKTTPPKSKLHKAAKPAKSAPPGSPASAPR